MTFEDFTALVIKLPETHWKGKLEKNKVMMIKSPVAEWARLLEKLSSEVSELKTDAITKGQVMQEL